MLVGRWLSDDVRRPIWYPSSDFISMEGKLWNKRTFKLKIELVKEKPTKTFCRSQWQIYKKLVVNFVARNTKKSTKYCRKYLRVFALGNYSEGYKINTPLSGLLVYRWIMPLAKRFSSTFHSFPRRFASRPPVHFSGSLSALGIILRYTRRRKGFLFLPIIQGISILQTKA